MSTVRMPRHALTAMTAGSVAGWDSGSKARRRGYRRARPARLRMAVFLLAFAATLLPVAPALAAYSSSLTAPTPPAGSEIFSWAIGGVSSNPNKEIGSAELDGCWNSSQVAHASATDANNNALPVKVQAKGPRAGHVEISNLSDARLPARVTLQFTARFGSQAAGTTLVLQAGNGSSGKERLDVGGPTCEPAHALTRSATGGGTTAATPDAPTYAEGTKVTLLATAAANFTFSGWTIDGSGGGRANPYVLTMDREHTVVANFVSTGPPPDPATVAPPIDPSVASDIAGATSFLYSGSSPIQTGVAAGTIEPERVAVLRGRVAGPDGTALAGVDITVAGRPEFGRTLTRADGMFDMAVNGGGQLTLRYGRDGFLPVDRNVVAPWRDYAFLPDVVMTALDDAVTTVDLSSSAPIQVAQGTPVIDSSGTRQATLLFPQGTQATMTMPDGSNQPLSSLAVRATEYTVGARGPKAMPGDLPATSAYTYAADFTVDEAIAADAVDVRFSKPVITYVDNFLNFPAGMDVPVGYFDRQKGAWVPSEDGRIIAIVSETTGRSDIDIDGNGTADGSEALEALGFTDAEREHLAGLYDPGKTLWRVAVTHFTPWDYNWPYTPPDDATAPNGGPVEPPKDPGQDCPELGSVIGCQSQTLGESVPIVGTPFRLHYQSDRTPGTVAGLDIPLTGESVPASLARVDLKVTIAGRELIQSFPPTPSSAAEFVWDGRDAYGRELQGTHPAVVEVGFVYPAVYRSPGDFSQSFGNYGGAKISGSSERGEISISSRSSVAIGSFDARGLGLGGWTLSAQHVFDPAGRTLYMGDGSTHRAEQLGQVITTVPGLTAAYTAAAAPDGALYLADINGNRVLRMSPDGTTTTVAGRSEEFNEGFSGDGGPATEARLSHPGGIAIASDGSILIADTGNQRIRRVGPDRNISTIAGNGVRGFGGDGGPATGATLADPFGVEVGPDGTFYIADTGNNRIRRVDTAGIISTMAGTGSWRHGGDGGRAAEASFDQPHSIALGPQGELYLEDTLNSRVRRIGPDGTITTVAGNGSRPAEGGAHPGDGGPAKSAPLTPTYVDVAADGTLYILDASYDRSNEVVRVVDSAGTITTVAGSPVPGFGEEADGIPAAAARLSDAHSVAIAPDRSFYVTTGSPDRQVRHVGPPVPGFTTSARLVPGRGGSELYEFDALGRHVRTMEALTKAVVYEFSYDNAGRLSSVRDVDGNVTTIERDGGGGPSAIVSPGGQRTSVELNADGYLKRISNPASQSVLFDYFPKGLLKTFTDARAGVHTFAYGPRGELVTDRDPAGGSKTLARTELADGHKITLTTGLGRTTSYEVRHVWYGKEFVTTDAAGGQTVNRLYIASGKQTVSYPDGTHVELQSAPDPRWGMQSAFERSFSLRTPDGLTQTATASRAAVLSDPTDPLSLTSLTDTTTTNGATFGRTYDAATRTMTMTSAEGRKTLVAYDAKGRTVSKTRAEGTDPLRHTYDAAGLLTRVDWGNQFWTYGYDHQRRLASRTDAFGYVTTYGYDDANRLIRVTAPHGEVVRFQYDAAGNRTGVIMPNGEEHTMAYSSVDLLSSYVPPGGPSQDWTYDADRFLQSHTFAGGHSEVSGYDPGRRLASTTSPEATVGFEYHGATERLMNAVRTPSGQGGPETVSYTYDGSLVTGADFAGPTATAAYTYTYDENLFLTGVGLVSGADTVSTDVIRDDDGLITSVGRFAWTRGGPGGVISRISDSSFAFDQGFDTLGRVSTRSAAVAAAPIYREELAYDAAGRVSTKVETRSGATHTFDYTYDPNGQLTDVTRDGVPFETYGYDQNGNRTSRRVGNEAVRDATYDRQDRITSGAGMAYVTDGAGFVVGRGADSFTYDSGGRLIAATTGDTTSAYSYDAMGRRVAQTVTSPSGQRTHEYLYGNPGNPLQVTAERTGADLTVLHYDDEGVLYAFDRAGTAYYVGTDHLGSPTVVAGASGNVVKVIEYGSFGAVLADSNPGFDVPLGYAGGIPDAGTRLVHFGFRDYDPASGRWMTRDPVLYGGQQANLYVYVGNNPINLKDPTGLFCMGFSAYEGVGGGAKLCSDEKGMTICAEVGVGLGASIDVEPIGNGGNKGTLIAEVVGECGPISGGLGVQMNHCGQVSVQPKCGIADELGFSAQLCETKVSQGLKLPTEAKVGRCGVQGKFAYELCRRFDN